MNKIMRLWQEFPATVQLAFIWFVLLLLGLVILAFLVSVIPLIVVGALTTLVGSVIAGIRVFTYFVDER